MSVIGVCILWGVGAALGLFVFALTLLGLMALVEVLQRHPL